MTSMHNKQRQGFQREGDAWSPIAINNSLAFYNDADRLFSLSGLYRRLARWIEDSTKLYSGDVSSLSAFMATPEYEFSYRLLCARHFAMEKVKEVVDNPFSDENLLQTLYDHRERLIDELQLISFAILWPQVIYRKDEWQVLVKRMPWNNDNEKNNIRIFFQIVGEIAVITDVLNKKASDYGLDIDYSRYDDFVRRQKNNRLDKERLAKAIEACAHHIINHSDWAVVYRVLCQSYGWDCNMATFERRIKELKFHKELKKCKDVGKTLNNNSWMTHTIEDWEDGKKKTFAQDFIDALEKELA